MIYLEVIQTIIALILIGFLVRFFPSYLKYKGKNLATKEDIEEITRKIEGVRSEYVSQTERLKSELGKLVHVHKVQFEKEFVILQEVWGKLVELQNATRRLRPIYDSPEPDLSEEQRKDMRLKKFDEAFRGYYEVVEKSKPFYPQIVYDELTPLMKSTYSEAVEYRVFSPVPNKLGYDEKYYEKMQKNIGEIIERVDKICDVIRRRVSSFTE